MISPLALSLSKGRSSFPHREVEGRCFDKLSTSGFVLATLLLAGCGHAETDRDAAGFPLPDRPVASIVSPRWSTEPERDLAHEADAVIAAAGVKPGMAVADIGAGEGYYTLHLAKAVGGRGQVIAEDIMPAYVTGLRQRVDRSKLANVSVSLGKPDDAQLPPASADRIFLIHMYHEIGDPYALMARLRPALRPGGRIIIVDANRETGAHGTPPTLLKCEMAAVGYRQIGWRDMPAARGYLAAFVPVGEPPRPEAITVCKA
ncbi:SAM-dependent methyltransferase [Sphingomonas vulcanisoli]|uniref:SAM-dependent methyltransferase n=1 Tax=Sphingomonas vulcanisoli TaxID=1658060 RepID=A0ABX0TVV2_9SPHN|nr:class I SAM-dependent methyltransferase [Sphingomonas vulcanisoli]NIJ07721.1 SAM-dependent methyltransferase [Sphingomonas vulcanisoli]